VAPSTAAGPQTPPLGSSGLATTCPGRRTRKRYSIRPRRPAAKRTVMADLVRWLVKRCVPVVLGAATAVGTTGPDRHAWADDAATSLSANKPEAPSSSSPGTGSESRRPPPLFPPPDDRPGH